MAENKNVCEHGTPYSDVCDQCIEELARQAVVEEKFVIPNCIHEKPFNKCGFCSTSDWQA